MTQIWAHRGASLYAPENTAPAFGLAIAQGAEGVELDVQLSSDGAVVVIHDETVDRTTDGVGRVVDHSLAALRELTASAGHDGFDGVGIPTLDEVLDLLAPTGRTVNIELKISEEPYPGLEEKVVARIADFGIGDRVVLSSFNDHSVRRLRTMAPQYEVAAIYTEPLLRPWRLAAELGAGAIHPPLACVFGRAFVARAHRAGIRVRPWVVNTPASLRRVFRSGVDAIFTDAPDVALAVREGRPSDELR